MAVSSVFPPSASPTEGDDPCEIDVTDVAIHGVMPLIGLCGLVGNGAVLWLQHMKPITDYIFNQAFDDFFFLLFMIPSTLLFLLENVSCSPIIPRVYSNFLFQLSMVSYHMGLYRLMSINTKRCRSTHYQLCYHCHLPQSMLWVVMRALQWAFFYTVIAVNPTVTSLCQSYKHEHCWGAVISMYTLNLFLFAAPVVISSTMLFIKAKCGSQQQQPEWLDIVFLIALFTLPLSICNFLQQLGYITVSSQVFFLLACIHSTIKPFIYFSVGSCRRRCWSPLRDCIQRVFVEPKDNTPSRNAAAMGTVV
ncbi:mas-related G-protein coupled receptor member H-like [Corvus moneduloides]|uniref:mas-related G-protein coupled receptor member H-like n=1 Tax=Corvus moneduloides TaxID=1196302 RepID=UPI0013645D89|nr:mas-related G-protein coupled receptor member H-like [Corvus moneduloides]